MYTISHLVQTLKASSKLVDWEARKPDIITIAVTAIVRSMNISSWCPHADVIISINNGIGILPKDLIRLIRVRDLAFCPVKYNYIRGQNVIKPRHIIKGKLCIDYWSVPNGEDGYPPISVEQFDYLVKHVKATIFEDYFLEGKINGNAFQLMKQEEEFAFQAANLRYPTADEMESALWMMRNGNRFPQQNGSRIAD